jgi:hypothetical protein
MALLAGMPIGALISGRLGDVIGLRPTIAGSGALLIALTAYVAVRSDRFSGIDVTGDEHRPAVGRVSPPNS